MSAIGPVPRKKTGLDKPVSAQDREYVMLGLRIVGEFGAIIAVPIVLFALGGKWLDAKYGTEPMFLIAGFVVAVALSAHMVYRKARQFNDEYLAIEDKSGKPKEPPTTV